MHNLRCGSVPCELSCVCMRCGAACGQGLWTRRSMQMHFLLSAPSLVWRTVVLAGRTKLRVSKNFFPADIFLYWLNISATAALNLKQKISKTIVQF